MNYTKPALSFEQRADQLLQRGLVADRSQLMETLSRVSHHRLSAYWHPFKRVDDTFLPGTTLAMVWHRYTFDRQLRLLVMNGNRSPARERGDASARCEVYGAGSGLPAVRLTPTAVSSPPTASRRVDFDGISPFPSTRLRSRSLLHS